MNKLTAIAITLIAITAAIAGTASAQSAPTPPTPPPLGVVTAAALSCPVLLNQYIAKPPAIAGGGPYYSCQNFAVDTIAWMQCEGITGYYMAIYPYNGNDPNQIVLAQQNNCYSGHAITVYPTCDSAGDIQYCAFEPQSGNQIADACWFQDTGAPNPPLAVLVILSNTYWPECANVVGLTPVNH